MADVNPVQGPMGPKEDPHKRDLKKMGTPEKFKETYRVQAISEADAESKKKRKRQEESPETGPAPEGAAPPTTNQSLEPSPFEVQKPGSKVSAAPSSSSNASPSGSYYSPSGAPSDAEGSTGMQIPQQQGSTQPTPPSQSPPAMQPQEPSDPQEVTTPAISFSEEDLFSDEEDSSYDIEPQPQGQEAAPPSVVQTSQPSTTPPQGNEPAKPTTIKQSAINTDISSIPSTTAKDISPKKTAPHEAAMQIQKPLSSPFDKKEEEKMSNATLTKPPAAEKTEKKDTVLQHPSTIDTSKEQIKQNFNIPAEEEAQATQQPIEPLPLPAKESKIKEISPEESSLSWKDESQMVSAISSESKGDGDHKRDREHKEEEPPTQISAVTADAPAFTPQAAPISQSPLPSYTSFSPALLEMFDKMVGTISVLQEFSGERKTTITLTSENFSSSPFYGAEIVIEEDLHLAPGQYNIKLIGSPEATTLFQAKTDDLLAAFQSGNYNFKVQRIETVIQSAEKHLFQRKEKVGGDADKDMGGGEKQ